jgi:general secretion pathway protein A
MVGTQLRIVPITSLIEHWFGEFVLLWQPPVEYQGALRPGDSGPLIQWLDAQLALINDRSPRAADGLALQGALLEELQQFQSEVGLVPDGVVGPYTLIQVSNQLGTQQPTLNSSTKG